MTAAGRHERRRRWRVPVAVAAAVIVADQLSKWWAVSALEGGRTIDLLGSLRLNLVRNTGASFGAGEGLGWLLAPLAIVISLVLVGWARSIVSTTARVALGFVVGGALGNVIDRVARAEDGWFSGGVVDFIDAQFWPVFNVADMGVTCGVVALVVLLGREPRPAEATVDTG